jgi:enoyl-CoA hydratase
MLEMLKQKLLNLTDPAWLAANGFNGRNPIGALIITGAGDRAFSAGADLDAIKKMDEVGIKKTLLLTRWINNILEKSRFPTIAAFNGITFGLGLELGLACRLRYACEEALLALPETRVGLIPGAGGTIRLPRLIGEGRAQEMIMTGNPMCAMRAYETGLVNRVFTTETLLPEVEAIAQKIAQTSPDAIDYANAAILAGRKGEDAGLYQEAKLFEDLSQNLATRQTISSFLKKDKG